MAIYNLGSINIDHFYRLPHLVRPGETLAADNYSQGLGGKGANQSVAIAKTENQVFHIGALNRADSHYFEQLKSYHIDLTHTQQLDYPSGHGIVMVDEVSGENQIVVYPGANHQISESMIDNALADANPGDWALTQNETTQASYFFKTAKSKGLKLCYSAAPFVAETTIELLPMIDMLVVNQIEAQELEAATGKPIAALGIKHTLITQGSAGVRYIGTQGELFIEAPKVSAVDTTGAGDTFLGLFLGRFDAGSDLVDSIKYAVSGAALQVMQPGTADAIPEHSSILEMLQKSFS